MKGSFGGGFRGGRGGAGGANFSTGPPDQVLGTYSSIPQLIVEMGTFMHACEGDMLYESTNAKIPYFNAPIYLENKVLKSLVIAKNSH